MGKKLKLKGNLEIEEKKTISDIKLLEQYLDYQDKILDCHSVDDMTEIENELNGKRRIIFKEIDTLFGRKEFEEVRNRLEQLKFYSNLSRFADSHKENI